MIFWILGGAYVLLTGFVVWCLCRIAAESDR